MEVITTHINADFDSLASMLAAKKLYPQGVLVFPGSQEKNLRDFFLQSAFYAFETERLRKIDLAAVRRLILVDTRQPGRIGRFGEIVGRPEVELHIYDHHPSSPEDLHGTVEHIREVGATITILLRILREREVPLTAEESTIMALGLYEDTGSFTFPSTTVEDFEAAAYLLSRGANLNVVSDMTTRELSAEQVSLLNELVQSATRYHLKGTEVVIAEASADRYVGDFAFLVHKLKDMENINVLFALARLEDRVYLVGRSRLEAVNVGEIAALFGGGGHPTAASATIKDLSLPEVKEKLLRYLEGRISPLRRASDLMSFPVKTVQAGETIEHAGDLLTRYNINVLPVMENGRVAGVITRQVIEKAIFHGFKDSPVRHYMNSEVDTVTPRTALSRIQELIVQHNQRLLPVMEKGEMVGVITRTDLLRSLQVSQVNSHHLIEQDPGASPRKKSVLQLMEERLPPATVGLLRRIGRKAEELGFQAYAVGGFVRDLILRQENLDLDVVVEGDGIMLARALAEKERLGLRVHQKFGTATLILPDGHHLDVATARLEYYDHPAALPRVEHSSIKLDLFRRDFTINALAIHLQPASFGQLIDFFGAQRDIKERTIRVLHNLSFVEDPTRIFRALRFEQRFGFQLAKHTHMLLENAVRQDLLGRLSGRRLFRELMLCLSEDRPFPVLKRMGDYGVLRSFHPRLAAVSSLAPLFQCLEGVVSWYTLLFTGEPFEKWLAPFLGLVDGLAEREMRELLIRLSLPEKFREEFSLRRRKAVQVGQKLLMVKARRAVYSLLHPLPASFLLYAMARAEREEVKKAISLYFTVLKNTRVALTGNDLKKMGFSPGPIFTEILKDLLRAKLDQKLPTREDEMAFVRKKYGRRVQRPGRRPAPPSKEVRRGER